jgi:hypothetical protein
LVAVAISAVLPKTVFYDKGMAPLWVPLLAAVFAIVAALVNQRRLILVCGWTAAVLFLWSASGVVLDGFRAFYWVTGIPAGDFAQVDGPALCGAWSVCLQRLRWLEGRCATSGLALRLACGVGRGWGTRPSLSDSRIRC